MKLKFLFVLLLFYGIEGYCQQGKNIRGNVTNNQGEVLIKATLIATQSKKSAITNGNGDFRLVGVIVGETISISMVGYETQNIIVGDENNINISLNAVDLSLEDVVVIGYGAVKRKDLTGSVGSANVSDMSKAPVTTFQDALAGRVAGVQVSTSDGQPGATSNVLVRGGNSITQSTAPLYVIDGFPMEASYSNMINPDDIASIEVLKDASSTAIYGARGANGVIMITTKQGKIGPPQISYNNWVGFQQPTGFVEVMSPYEFVKYQYELVPTRTQQLYLSDGRTLDSYKDIKGADWQNMVLKDATSHSHSISLRGGTTATKYSLSLSYLDQQGIIINTGYKRYQGRFQIDQRIGKNVRVGINTNYSNGTQNGQILQSSADELTSSNAGNVSAYRMFSIWGYKPVSGRGNIDDLLNDPFDEDITASLDQRVNPVLAMRNDYNYTYSRLLYSNAFLEVSFLKNLKLKVTGGINDVNNKSDRFNNSYTAAGSPNTAYGSTYGINGSIGNSYNRSLLNENTLTFTKAFRQKHRLNIVGGFTMQRNNSESNGYTSILLPNESLGINGLGQGTPISQYQRKSYATLASFLGRINYNFDSRYFFTASFRSDGSSKFAPGNRWGYFPSGAVAWNIAKEKFMKNIEAVSDMKLRVSYGVTGNNRVSDFAYMSILQQGTGANSFGNTGGYYFGDEYLKAIVPTSIGNEKLKWEKTANLDIGLDISLLKDKINFTTDYYFKRTTDLLLNASIPTSSGYEFGFRNIGVVSNRGLEFTLNTVNLERTKFSWNTSFNIAFNTNKIIELNDDVPALLTRILWNGNFNTSLPYIAIPDQNVSQFYGYVFDGLYQLEDFELLPGGTYLLKPTVPNNGNASANIQPGHIKYKDLNGDGIVNVNDQTVIGNPNPIHIGGMSNNFRYGQFDLNVFFQWSYGNDALNANRIIFEGAEARTNLNMFKTFEKRWSMDNQNSLLPVAGGYGPNVYSNRTIEDASFIRLKTISLGYNLPTLVLNRIHLKSARVHFSAQNLVTWTRYSGLDPEVSVRNSALTPGFDWSPYPRAKVLTVGLNITL